MLKLKILKRALVDFLQDKRESCRPSQSGISRLQLGESVEKRPVCYYQIGSGERKILFVSAMHGNEIGTIKLAYFLLDYLNSYGKKYEKLSCYVVPCLNVDGFERAKGAAGYFKSGRGRRNSRDVDLNRNFPASNFRSQSYILSKKIGISKYNRELPADAPKAKDLSLPLKNCGAFGGSEPETKILIDFIEKEKVSVIFSFHNSGRDVMGGKNELSKKLVKIYAKETGYEILEDTDWLKIGQTGTMKDWCDEHEVSFVEVEGSTRYGSDWKVQKPALEAVLKFLEETI